MNKRKCTVESTDYEVEFPMTVSATVRCPIELRKLNLNEDTRSSLIEITLSIAGVRSIVKVMKQLSILIGETYGVGVTI